MLGILTSSTELSYSAASCNMLPYKCVFSNLNVAIGVVSLGDEHIKLPIKGTGYIKLVAIGEALYVPRLTVGLISVLMLDKLKYNCVIRMRNGCSTQSVQ